jgi:hypothetical protein
MFSNMAGSTLNVQQHGRQYLKCSATWQAAPQMFSNMAGSTSNVQQHGRQYLKYSATWQTVPQMFSNMAGSTSNLTFTSTYMQCNTDNTKDIILSKSYYFRTLCSVYYSYYPVFQTLE